MSIELVIDNDSPVTLTNQPEWNALTLDPIASHTAYVACAEHLKTIKAFQKRVIEFFLPHKQRAMDAHRALCADEKKALEPALADESRCKTLLVDWDTAQEQIRRDEERRRQEAARIEEERRRIEEAAAMETEAAATGNADLMEEAVALIAAPVAAPVIVVARETPRVSGISYRENWKYRVVDANKVPREYLMVDESKIRRVVAAMKGQIKIAGVEVYVEKTAAAGSR